jgi:hypothetical protein
MSLFGAVWMADLMQDRSYQPIREQNTAFEGGGFGDLVTMMSKGGGGVSKSIPYVSSTSCKEMSLYDHQDNQLFTC